MPGSSFPRTAGLLALGGAVVFGLVSCGPPQQQGPPPPPPPLVTVARPALAPVQNYYEYNGYLEAVETVEVRARVRGLLKSVWFVEGDEVRKGDLLYRIDTREYDTAVARAEADILKAKADILKAEADITAARAQVGLAEAELSRLKSIPNATASELDKARATLAANKAQQDVAASSKRSAEAAVASTEAAKHTAEIQLGYTEIRALISGRISRTHVTPGNLVGQTEATLLTTIVSVDPIYVYFDAPERDLVEYQRSLAGRLGPARRGVVEVQVATETGYPHVGVLDFKENKVESSTGTVRVRGRLTNPLALDDGVMAAIGVVAPVAVAVSPPSPAQDLSALVGAAAVPPPPAVDAHLLYSGLFARVRVPNGPAADRPLIPEEALMTGQEGRFVYVVGPENKVLKRTVRVGTTVWRAPPADDAQTGRWRLTGGQPDKDGKTPPPGVVRAMVAVESGLTADDRVLVNGLQKARPGAAVAPDERKLQPPK